MFHVKHESKQTIKRISNALIVKHIIAN